MLKPSPRSAYSYGTVAHLIEFPAFVRRCIDLRKTEKLDMKSAKKKVVLEVLKDLGKV